MFWQLINPSVSQLFVDITGSIVNTQISYLFWIFIILGLLMSIAVHEWAHAYSAHLLGDDTAKNEDRMNINPLNHFDVLGLVLILFTFFGYGKPVPVNAGNFRNPAKDMMLVSLAGPASNFVLAFFCGITYASLTPFLTFQGDLSSIEGILKGTLTTFIYSLGTIGLYNLGLMTFNLLPVHPLDGRKIWGYLNYRISEFLMRYIDPLGFWAILIFLLPFCGGYSIISLLSLPIYTIYTLAFRII